MPITATLVGNLCNRRRLLCGECWGFGDGAATDQLGGWHLTAQLPLTGFCPDASNWNCTVFSVNVGAATKGKYEIKESLFNIS